MSEFTSGLFVPQAAETLVQPLSSLGVPGVILPASGGSVVLLPWEHWDALTELVPAAWSYAYTPDYGHLMVTGFRDGQPWLRLDFNDPGFSDEFDELLDEDGLYPDGSAGPEVARAQTWEAIEAAHRRGDLDAEQTRVLLSAAEGNIPTDELIEDLPPRLGFAVQRWLQPEDLNHRSREQWLDEYPDAVVVGG